MLREDLRRLAQASMYRLAFDRYLRTGLGPMESAGSADTIIEMKFNPYHDPDNGRFTFAPGGTAQTRHRKVRQHQRPSTPSKSAYEGMTAKGKAIIQPTGGGYVDANGHYVAEQFPPDPYHLSDPFHALAHYLGGSGEARNFYLNAVDMSQLTLSDFPAIEHILSSGKPGIYPIKAAAAKNFDTSLPPSHFKFSAANTVGRLGLHADGILVISPQGRYSFNGKLSVPKELYRFPASKYRTSLAEHLTTFGRQLPGKDYRVYVIGAVPLERTGPVKIRRAQ